MNKNLSRHVTEDRMERVLFIIDAFKGDFGKPIAEDPEGDAVRTLTDKGILIVTNLQTGKLVTMWIATVEQGTAIYRNCHQCSKCPLGILKILNRNKKLAARQP